MDEAFFVRGFERVGDLPRDGQRLGQRHRPARDVDGEVFPLDKLHHDRDLTVDLFEPVDVRDVRMVERRQRLRFAGEPRDTIGIAGQRVGQHLDGHLAIEPGVARAVHLAHAAGAKGRDDFVGAEARAARDAHGFNVPVQMSPSVAVSV